MLHNLRELRSNGDGGGKGALGRELLIVQSEEDGCVREHFGMRTWHDTRVLLHSRNE